MACSEDIPSGCHSPLMHDERKEQAFREGMMTETGMK
jgi:hypothetical protein